VGSNHRPSDDAIVYTTSDGRELVRLHLRFTYIRPYVTNAAIAYRWPKKSTHGLTLSQLSYSPNANWEKMDSNHRPHTMINKVSRGIEPRTIRTAAESSTSEL
jgi:hypothetical protein